MRCCSLWQIDTRLANVEKDLHGSKIPKKEEIHVSGAEGADASKKQSTPTVWGVEHSALLTVVVSI